MGGVGGSGNGAEDDEVEVERLEKRFPLARLVEVGQKGGWLED